MIKFVREYNFFNTKMYDVVYPNRCRTCMEKDLPKTAREFIRSASSVKEQNDVLHGKEIIYRLT